MKCIQVFAVLVCFGAVFGKPSTLNENATTYNKINMDTFDLMVDARVVGGQTAPEGAIPWQVSLRDSKDNHFCGGTIISSKYVLTAAHCVVDGPPAHVVVGTNRRTSGGTRYPVNGVRSFPRYEAAIQRHDIALVKLVYPIKMTERVKAICLAQEDTPAGTVLLVSGWGRTSYPGATANQLQYVKLLTIGQTDCRHKLASVNKVFAEQICTLTTKGQGACHGDSGGPLVGRDCLYGVVSWGYPCAQAYPDVFTKVFSYKNWIETVMQSSP